MTQPREFDRLLDSIIDAMPEIFDAHQAQRWYEQHFPEEFSADLNRYGRDEHVFARDLSKAIDRRIDVKQIGTSQHTTNMRGRLSTCTVWQKVMATA
mgnify:CR=1 FL=1